MNPLYQKKFNVDYFEINDSTWKIASHVTDEEHDIDVEVDVSVPDMIIKDVKIKFNNYPLEYCLEIEKKASILIGVSIRDNYRETAYKTFIGPQGCPSIISLLNISVPGFIYIYYLHLVKVGKMKEDDMTNYFMTNFPDDCLAHTLFNKNN